VPEHEYPTYPRRFISYRWFKPLLAGLLFAVLYLGSNVAIVLLGALNQGGLESVMKIAGSYDTMDVSSGPGILLNLGSLAVAIPLLALTALIVRDRPFSSYSSARGGWDWSVFGRMMLLALLVCGVPNLVWILLDHGPLNNQFTIATFLLLTVMGPLQCIAEEYMFRGLLMQTFGGWFRIPVIAVVLQALIFMAMHPYNLTGKLTILATGCMMGLMAWISRGIEASSAIHIVNNMVAFYADGLGLGAIGSEVSTLDLVVTLIIDAIYVAVLLVLRKKGFFDRIKRDDAAEFNAKVAPKYAKRDLKNMELHWKPGVAGSAAAQENKPEE
ncbi:MAG: CPBP family intramembrane metalloprotease, partial [Firmicutes bacterium]|nr:CPBP family intramembrane metalloprotease [Bacillota bacterium]